MTGREKIDAAVAELRDRKVGASTAAPLLYRFFWALGILVPPPLFQSFLGILIFQGSFFALVIGIAYALAMRVRNPLDWLAVCVGSGLVFGFLIAVYFRAFARRLGLPRWAEYIPGGDEEENADW